MIFRKIPVFDEMPLIFQQCSKVVLAGVGLLILTFPITVLGQQSGGSALDLRVPQRFQTGLNVADSAMADIDGDGNLDLAVVNAASIGTATTTLLFGTGDGGFAPPIVLPTDAVGSTIAVGDLNNDGRPDVVVATYIENVLIVFLNQGNRQFSGPVFTQDLTEHNGEYLDLAIADFDGDGTNDVVGLQDQSGQRLRFFHADAQGRLTVFALFSQGPFPDSSYGSKIAVGDVNGDHRPDVVWFDDDTNGYWDMFFIYGQPQGTPLSRVRAWPLQASVLAAQIVDVDNDGDNDIVMIGGGIDGALRVLRNDNTRWTVLPGMQVESPFPPNDLTVADFNNDGKKDLAVLHGSVYHSGVMVGIRYGVGDGTFIEGKYYATSKSKYIFSGDLNHDNKTDILTVAAFPMENAPTSTTLGVSNNTCSVLLNEDLRGFKAPLVALWGPNFIDRGDFNEDGQLDMVSSWATTWNAESGADVSINDRAGGFFEDVHYPSPANLRDMKAGDFNGDGHADAVTAHSWGNTRKLAVYLGNGSGSLGTPVVSSITQAVSKIVVADFNRDGKDDVLIVDENSDGYCMLSVGDGNFVTAPGSPIPLANTGETIPAVDVNGDQIPDLVTVSQFTNLNATKIWIGDGTGRFSQLPTTLPALGYVVAGDFNGDGKVDLAGTTPSVGTLPPWRTDIAITGFLGDGNGGFSGSFSQNIPDYSNYRTASSIETADFDLDGFDDIAMIQPHNVFGNLIIIRSGGSTPSWQEPIFVAADTASRTVKVGDFDGNGRPDIEWLGDNSRGVIYNGARRQQVHSAFDYDGDGKSDVSVFRPSSSIWYLNRSQAGFASFQFGAAGDVLTPADFTGDGKTDIAVFRPSNGTWYVMRSEDNTFYGTAFGANADIPAPGDYDGDGKADMAVYRPSTGTWYLQRSTAGFTALQFGIAEDKPTPGDFDGDGKSDIAVFRPSTGIWYRINSSNGSFFGVQFGAAGDKIVPADYTGDGKTDIAVWRPSNGTWYVLRSEDGSFYASAFGQTGDLPTPGDYDGDGKADIAVYRP